MCSPCSNNEIHSARDVTKTNAFRVNTFDSRDFGCLGYVDADGQVLFYRERHPSPHQRHALRRARRPALPRVDIVYAYAGADGVLIDALRERGTDGLVLTVSAAGRFPPPSSRPASARSRRASRWCSPRAPTPGASS